MRFPVFSGVALYLTLAVLREREGLAVPVSDRWKIFSKKNFEKIWWLRKNLLPLQTLSLTNGSLEIRNSSLKDFR